MAYKKKSELIEEAIAMGCSPEKAKSLKRDELCELITDTSCNEGEDKGENKEGEKNESEIRIPEMHSEDWSEYILSLLGENELIEGMPTCDGLRRVFKVVIGDILGVDMNVLKAPTLQDPSATVKCTIKYAFNGPSYPRGIVKDISDVFDVNSENTPWPFCKASVATAATKAEARALRKGLGLTKVYSSEEMHQGFESTEQVSSLSVNDEGNKLASDSAKIAITTLSNKLNIDFDKLFKFMGLEETSMPTLTYEQSHQVIALLNEFSRGKSNGGQEVPEELYSEVLF
jgi:hypothetical protein